MMKIFSKSEGNVIARAPQLDTVLMVEDFIEKHSGEMNKTEIFKALPKKMMWNTFKLIIAYLENLNKIIVNKDGTVTWIWNPKLVEKYLKRKDLEIRV